MFGLFSSLRSWNFLYVKSFFSISENKMGIQYKINKSLVGNTYEFTLNQLFHEIPLMFGGNGLNSTRVDKCSVQALSI
jgi:hypothetical protein